jgi:multidrug efflux pump subunit AcrB
MSRFAIQTPYLIVVVCLVIAILGAVAVVQMPVDMFPAMNIPVVEVATFFSGMPPEQVESNITYHLERFFTLAAGVDHIESRSLNGVSVIKVYFQSDTDAATDAATIANLAIADMRDLPPGTFPPIVLKSDASSLPVCLVTVAGAGLDDSHLKDLAQNFVRNQLASVPGASIPQPFGGPWRQIQFYVDPHKLESRQLSPMDVVRALNLQNVILPAGDVQIGNFDYDIYSNSQLSLNSASEYPVKMNGDNPVLMSDIGQLKDSHGVQYNVVHIDGARAVYLPVLKAGGNANTIAMVDGVRKTIQHLVDVPTDLKTSVVFDQSRFVRTAIQTLLDEGGLGLFLTCVMILVFLGSMRATVAVFFSVPLSALGTFIFLKFGGSSVNSMVLGGMALVLSRLIDNSVVVLENIYRHLEMGEPRRVAAENGGKEVALPVLASTLTTAVVFLPVTLLTGVSKFLFSAMGLTIVIALFISFFVAMTVVPLFCARFLRAGTTPHAEPQESSTPSRRRGFNAVFNTGFHAMLRQYERAVVRLLAWPKTVLVLSSAAFVASLWLYPLVGRTFFPQTDGGQFIINLKGLSGTRLDVTEHEIVDKVEPLIRDSIAPGDLSIIIDNIGLNPGFSSLYSPNSAMHTGFVQVGLTPDHKVSSYAYIAKIKKRLAAEVPQFATYFSTGSLVDSVVNMGALAPIDVQIAGRDLDADFQIAKNIAADIRKSPVIDDVYIPQDLDYPSLRVDVDRIHAAKMGLTEREILTNLITSLTSNQQVAPNIWIDPNSGNNYFLTVQFPELQLHTIHDLDSIPLHKDGASQSTRLGMVASIHPMRAPTEVDHFQIRRQLDIYVRPSGENLGAAAEAVNRAIARQTIPSNVDVSVRGAAEAMNASFRSFALGLTLSVVLLYLILVAQFRSVMDPLIILLALPPAISGVLLTLVLTGTTLNIMSLMGVIMLAGIAMSNSILIVEFAHHLRAEGRSVSAAIVESCRVRLRPILMTSLATIIGLLPMALKLGEGSESYAPLARALIGGLLASVALTVFLVPAGFFLAYRRQSLDEALSRPSQS